MNYFISVGGQDDEVSPRDREQNSLFSLDGRGYADYPVSHFVLHLPISLQFEERMWFT